MNNGNSPRRATTSGPSLKFAGALAAGLVAGILGVGAIAVPLIGWNEWPQALSPSGGGQVELSAAGRATGERRGSEQAPPATANAPRVTVAGPTSALALLQAASGTASPAG